MKRTLLLRILLDLITSTFLFALCSCSGKQIAVNQSVESSRFPDSLPAQISEKSESQTMDAAPLDKMVIKNILSSSDGTFESSCDPFFDKEGNIGAWGKTVLNELARYPETFSVGFPSKMGRRCANIKNFTAAERRLFWLWAIKAMASGESSCQQRQASGENTGLLQLDKDHCSASDDLSDPHDNIRCALRQLSFELKNRPGLTISHSKGPSGTYWAVLRNDPENFSRREAAVIERTQDLIFKFSLCQSK